MLQFASAELRDDREFVLQFVTIRQDADTFKHASIRLKDDPEVVTAAMEINEAHPAHTSDRLWGDRAFLRMLGSRVRLDACYERPIYLRTIYDRASDDCKQDAAR